MATPDFDHQSSEIDWSIQKDYVIKDNDGTMICAMTGFPRRVGEIVYQGAFIDEFIGFFTIGQDSAVQLAKLVGFVDPDKFEGLELEVSSLGEEIDALREVIDSQDLALDAYQTLLGVPEDDDEAEVSE